MILNIFDFGKTNFTSLFYKTIKFNNLGIFGIDRNTKSSYLKTLFNSKWNFIKWLDIVLEFIGKLMTFILEQELGDDLHSERIKSLQIRLLIQFQTDMNKIRMFIRIYLKNDTIKPSQFYIYLNEIFSIAFEEGELISTIAKRSDLIDTMKSSRIIAVDSFLSFNFDEYDPSESITTKTKTKNTTTPPIKQTHHRQNPNNNNRNNQYNPYNYYHQSNYGKGNNNYHQNPQFHQNQQFYQYQQHQNNTNSSYNQQNTNPKSSIKSKFDKMLNILRPIGVDRFANRLCLYYNDGNSCTRKPCGKTHLCAACNASHPLTSCPKNRNY